MKTNPIGVRFDKELLQELKEKGLKTPQQALSFLESNYKVEAANNRELGKKLKDAARGSGDEGITPPPKTYNQYLNLAKELKDEGEIAIFKDEVTNNKNLAPNQKSMIFSKLPKY